jgi:DNA-binding GntR family transcriptional regulator
MRYPRDAALESQPGGGSPSLAEQAYRKLEEMIVTLELPPGATLSEASLSQKTGFGRTPIREALKRLEHQGLVTSMPRKGLIVRDMKVEDQFTLVEVAQLHADLMTAVAGGDQDRAVAASDALVRYLENFARAGWA